MYSEKIKSAFHTMNIHLSDRQAEAFQIYYEMLIQWNENINLTAITEFEQVLMKHFIDSVAVDMVTDMSKIHKIIDVGTGAGFPGIPLKILYPDMELTLLDSLNKRVKYLQAVTKRLELSKVTLIHGRAEEIGRMEEYREQYDLCVSRAVANLSVLSEYCVPFVKTGGYFISYKAEEVEEEAETAQKAIRCLHCEKPVIEKVRIPGSDIVRSFVIIRKKGRTDMRYPRKPGVPAKNPL